MKELKIAIFDMEWTSWKGSHKRNWSLSWERKEIVQIGVILSKGLNDIIKKKIYFKVKRNTLSNYFQILNGITQNDYNSFSELFYKNFYKFMLFIKDADLILCNGKDKEILIENLILNNIKIPKDFNKISDIRPYLSIILKLKENKIVSSELPNILGIKHTLKKHDALADSLAIFISLQLLYKKKLFKIDQLLESIKQKNVYKNKLIKTIGTKKA